MGDTLALVALLLFAANAFVVRAASRRLEQGLGFLVSLVVNVVVGGLLLGGRLLFGAEPLRVDWPSFWMFLLAGVFSGYLGRRGYFKSVETLGPSRASAVQAANPMFTMVFAWVLIDQALGWVDVAAILVIVVGVYLTNRRTDRLSPALSGASRRESARERLALLAPAVVATASYGLGNVLRGGAVEDWNEPIAGGVLGAISATLAYLLFHISPRGFLDRVRRADRRGVAWWTLTGGLTIGGQMTVIGSAAHIDVAVAVAISSALPMIVIPVSVVVFRIREGVTAVTALGAALISGGVAWLVLL
ncbi:DMT family transporter [Jiangella mangrovi]|uniref:Drug/metabolite transporter (DMT)-like permease n=1 Tax=Jiangella mangrovi TaxID=1524084 RepID=A0A7W9GN17_9ACTN|nr:DMT family transporter [Jiangella mangrovi]MBB5786874.1 drug/metabolite transporter (DMT)-like permease [Jiangella mangrovi]